MQSDTSLYSAWRHADEYEWGKASKRSSDLLGPRASRPQMRREARSLSEVAYSFFRASRSFAGGTPAVPANHLTALRHPRFSAVCCLLFAVFYPRFLPVCFSPALSV